MCDEREAEGEGKGEERERNEHNPQAQSTGTNSPLRPSLCHRGVRLAMEGELLTIGERAGERKRRFECVVEESRQILSHKRA